MLGRDIAYMNVKLDHSSFSRSGYGWCPPTFKWFTWPDHAPFRDSLPFMG